jgi:tRNA splicing ligase
MIQIKNKNYSFDDFIELTKKKEEIKCKEEIIDGQKVYIFSYMVSMENTFDSDLARECRGIVFDENKNCICRPFHKFFNVGEKEFTLPDKIDWNNIDHVGIKHDGSMLTPVFINNKIYFKSKKSFYSDVVTLFYQEIVLGEFLEKLSFSGISFQTVEYPHYYLFYFE